jgi:hypothetical protein
VCSDNRTAKEETVRGGRLVTPAEAEDLPVLSLVDASLGCPKKP